ncbi:glutamine-hydrolyzing GMP synthase, partial [PVC group bacterium]|nr:glutamine-hydrolyzing GMP synthase [PVC group bacterium]
KVYCEIHPYNVSMRVLNDSFVKGIILSGGPSSVYGKKAPDVPSGLFDLDRPVLGVCYGMQLMCKLLGGRVAKAKSREYGLARISVSKATDLFSGFSSKESVPVWMSHGDHTTRLPKGFDVLARTSNAPYAAIRHRDKNLYGVQFHPEVAHTHKGGRMIANFIFKICHCRRQWTMANLLHASIKDIQKSVGNERVICGVSGGVDSLVASVILHKAIKKQLTCVFVNNGLLRLDEAKKVIRLYRKKLKINFRYVDATHNFLSKLSGVTDPEKKRKIIGQEFIHVFEREIKKIGHVTYLAQGTLYPDVIESISVKGPSATIKSHHNVGGLPKRMRLKLIEPLRELFKDEVRVLGRELKLPEEILMRQPFPGPGLAVRILGKITKKRLDILRQADHIVVSEIKKAGLYFKTWQTFAVLLPIKSVGVMGDERTYEYTIAVRSVKSSDGMTADWVKLPYSVLSSISSRLTNEVRGINRVVYDISSKPPSTIEWE